MANFVDPALLDLLRRMKRVDPVGWIDDVADAVRDAGGIDASDLLTMAADRAASGYDRDDVPRSPDAEGEQPGSSAPTN
jgi:hypothetical protein